MWNGIGRPYFTDANCIGSIYALQNVDFRRHIEVDNTKINDKTIFSCDARRADLKFKCFSILLESVQLVLERARVRVDCKCMRISSNKLLTSDKQNEMCQKWRQIYIDSSI